MKFTRNVSRPWQVVYGRVGIGGISGLFIRAVLRFEGVLFPIVGFLIRIRVRGRTRSALIGLQAEDPIVQAAFDRRLFQS